VANHKSAEKRARQNIVRNERNRSYRGSVRTAIKAFRAAVAAGADKASLDKLFQAAQIRLAKAAQKNQVHKNNANRNISRLAKLLKSVAGQGTAATKPAKAATPKVSAAAKAKKAATAKAAKATATKKASSAPAKKGKK